MRKIYVIVRNQDYCAGHGDYRVAAVLGTIDRPESKRLSIEEYAPAFEDPLEAQNWLNEREDELWDARIVPLKIF